ncbi:hypothetical protein LCGC14_0549540 [marine sediment metagenome]|uniref:Uncharacterized protein n=1 Tax=marine sediment metagenome TaxID=412755 RepID=A0A0F9S8Q4_9ZZZZ
MSLKERLIAAYQAVNAAEPHASPAAAQDKLAEETAFAIGLFLPKDGSESMTGTLVFDPGSDVDMDLLKAGFTGDSILSLDVSEDAFSFNKGLRVTSGVVAIGDIEYMSGWLNVSGGSAGREKGIWLRSQSGQRIHQINPNGNLLEIGAGGTIDTAPAMTIDTNAVNAFFLNSSGQLIVGAGTFGVATSKISIVGSDGAVASFPTVGAKDFLILENDGNCNINLIADVASFSQIKFTDSGAAGWRGAITYFHSADLMTFATVGLERIRITSAGAVTITNLAGAGSRTVVADANGVLSAP